MNSSSYEGISAGRDISVNGSVNVQAGAYGLYSGNGNIIISKDVTIKISYNSIYAPKGAVNIASGATWKMDSSGYTIIAKDIVIPSGSAIIDPADGEISESGSSKHTPSEHVIIGPVVVKYPVWVSGEQVTEANKSDVLGDGNVSYDPATKTLTVLDSSNITGTYKDALIYADNDLTINVPGGLTLSSNSAAYGVRIGVSGGKVTVNGSTDIAVNGIGISAASDVTLGTKNTDTHKFTTDKTSVSTSGNITVNGSLTADSANGAGLSAGGNVIITKDAAIKGKNSAIGNGGSVTIGGNAKLTSSAGHGINCPLGVTLGSGDTASHEIEAAKIAIYGSSITVNGSLKATAGEAGLSSPGDVAVTKNANITAVNTAIGNGGSVTVGGNATLTSEAGYGISAPGVVTLGSDDNAIHTIEAGDTAIYGGSITVNGSLKATAGKAGLSSSGDVAVTKDADIASTKVGIGIGGDLNIVGDVKIKSENDTAISAILGKVTVGSGTWTLDGASVAIAAKTITIPTDHSIIEPTDGVVSSETIDGEELKTVVSGDGTVQAHVVIAPNAPVKHTISYDLNGGTMDGSTGIVTVDVVEGTVITLPAPTREGYVFDYWEGSKYYAGDSYTVTEDHTFTAQWKEVEPSNPTKPTEYTVTFNMNGHGTQVPAQTVEKGNKATKPANPTASGYTFGGWYADATFSTKFDFNSAITANTTVYAKWTKNSAAPADPTNPQTGDNSNMFLWIALLLVSGGALVGTTVYGKKRKRAE